MVRRLGRAARAPYAGRTLSILVAAMILSPLATARGDEPTAEQTAAARSLGMRGVQLAEAGDCAHAVDPLTRAESLRHAPTTLEWLGECHIALGKLVVGTEELNRVIHEPLAPNSPAAFAAAQERARKKIDPAVARIGKLRIHVDHPAGVKPQVKVDDEVVFDAMLDADRPTDPGPHKVTVTAQGMKPTEAAVTLADAQSSSVALTLEPDPNAVVAAAPAAAPEAAPSPSAVAGPPASAPPQTAPAEPPNRTPAFVVLGVGVVGVAVGTIFGVVALGTKSTLDGECPNKNCPSASDQSSINSLGTQAWVSTIGFGVGIVGLGVGTVLLVTSGGSSGSASVKTGTRPHVTPYFGLTSAGLTGTF
jgi:hypothetical protein